MVTDRHGFGGLIMAIAYRYIRNVARNQIPTNNILTWRLVFPPPVSGGLNFRIRWAISIGVGTLPSQPTTPYPSLLQSSDEVWTNMVGTTFGPNVYISPNWIQWRLNPQPAPAITFFKLWCQWDNDLIPTITQLT